MQRADSEPALDPQIEQRLAAFREHYQANKQAREPAVVPQPAKEPAVKQEPEQKRKIERDRDLGMGR